MLNPLWLLFSIVVWLKKTTSLPKLYFRSFVLSSNQPVESSIFCVAQIAYLAPAWYGAVSAAILHSTQVFSSVLSLPESFVECGGITLSSILEALVIVIETGFELHFATTVILVVICGVA